MKHLLIFSLICVINTIQSQQIEKLFYSANKDRCFGLVQVSENNFIFAKNKNIGPNIANSIVDKNASLLLYNISTKEISNTFYIDEDDDVAFFRFLLNDTVNNNIIALGQHYINNERNIGVYRFDYSLNLINKSTFPFEFAAMFNALLNQNNNLVITGVKENTTSNKTFLLECNPEVGLINNVLLDSLNLFVPATFLMLNQRYYIYDFSFKWSVLNSNFEVDTTFSALKAFKPIYKAYVLDDKVYTGALHFNLKEYVYSIDITNTQDTFYSKSFSNFSTISQAGFYTLDGNKNGELFFSNTIGPGDPNITQVVKKNYISIHKIDTAGNLFWEYYIGGDSATYFTEHVLATKDGGCLLIFERFDLENEYGNEDVYYIKFDSDGNAEEDYFGGINPYTSISKLPKPQRFLIYPNPVKNELNFVSSDLNNKFIAVYNIAGQTIFTRPIKNKIDIDFMEKGNYFYTISNEHNEILQKGKFTKE